MGRSRTIYYNTDGGVAGIELTYQTANGPSTIDHKVFYRADGTIRDIEIVETNAEAGTKTVKTFHYRADGKVEFLEEVVNTADGVTKTTKYFKYDADGKLATVVIDQIDSDINGKIREAKVYTISGDDQEAIDALAEAEEAIIASTNVNWGEYGLSANPSGVETGVGTAEATLNTLPDTVSVDITATNNVIDTVTTVNEELEKIPRQITVGINLGKTPTVPGQGSILSDPLKGKPLTELWKETGGPDIIDMLYEWAGGREGPHGLVRMFLDYFTGEKSATTPEIPYEFGNLYWWTQRGRSDIPLAEKLRTINYTQKPAEEGGQEPEVTVEVGFEVEDGGVEDVAEDAKKEIQASLNANPSELKVIPELDEGGVLTDYSEGKDADGNTQRKMVYTVEVDGQEAVVDYFETIDKETNKSHIVRIMTEDDGTQTISETVVDLETFEAETYTTTIDADGNVITTLESAEALAEQLERTVTLTANASGNALTRLEDIRQIYNKLNNKTLTIKTKVEGDKLPDQKAEGDSSFKGGKALINEEGPELIVSGGYAKILGGGMPVIADIPKGARIYTAKETARLLAGVGGEKFYSFADGTVDWFTKLTLPPDKPSDDKKDDDDNKNNGGNNNNSSGSKSDDENAFWDTIKEYLEYGLKKIEWSIKEYQMSITLLERARDALLKPIEDELSDLAYSAKMLEYEIKLLERARDELTKPLDKEIDRLKAERQIRKEDEALEEKQLAVEEARANLLDAMHQRTVRYFNEETGQWEWMADKNAVKAAQDALDKAEKDYADAQEEYDITLLERQRDEINNEYQAKIDELNAQKELLDQRQEDLEHEKDIINREYELSIQPIRDQMDALQQTYDDLQYFYDRLVTAVEVPTDSLTDALKQMAAAAAQYKNNLNDTVKLLDTLFELAPGWTPIQMGDLGNYMAQNSQYGNYSTDNSTTVIINGVRIDGQDAQNLAHILRKRGLYS